MVKINNGLKSYKLVSLKDQVTAVKIYYTVMFQAWPTQHDSKKINSWEVSICF